MFKLYKISHERFCLRINHTTWHQLVLFINFVGIVGLRNIDIFSISTFAKINLGKFLKRILKYYKIRAKNNGSNSDI